MARFLKTDIYKKSYLIEFFTDETCSEVEESFTFSVPPESEELSYPQRKTETKTFGGLHVDDYGIDAVKITLSGSTINQELKRIYRPGKGDKWLTGEEEIYFLRDLLKRYKTGSENIKKPAVLYDLSKIYGGAKVYNGDAEKKFQNGNIKNYWRVFPGELKIRRASDRPLAYKYSIEFTGVDQDPAVFDAENRPELNKAKTGAIQSMMNDLKDALRFIDDLNGSFNNVLAKIGEANNLIGTLGDVMKYAAGSVAAAADSAGKTAAGTVKAVTNVAEGVITALPRTAQLAAVNIGLEVFNAASGLARSTAALVDECRRMFSPGGEYWEIPQEVLNQYDMTGAEFKDSVCVMLDETENAANELAAAAKSSDIPDVTLSNSGRQTGAQNIALSYGSREVILKDTDTLESLAAAYCGDPDAAIDIAAYNGIASLDELNAGDAVKIPITRKTGGNANNRIFARREDRDNYGRDIYLTDGGLVEASASGDFRLTGNVNNLSQAVLLRLRESVNKRIRLNAYGIRNNISDPTAGIAYILSSIDLTVRGDPRVRSVENIRFAGSGDGLNVIVDYRDINNAAGSAAGRA